VKAFTEKPNLELAKTFIASGDFLWNSGIFIWNLRSIEAALREHMPELAEKFLLGEQMFGTEKEEAFIQEMFPTCPSISIDYGLMEKASNVYVMPSDFGWSDLGTWGSLRENVARDRNGNAIIGNNVQTYETRDCVIHCGEERRVVVQGLEGYIVAEKDDTLLVCKLSEEQRIKLFSE
jgi:mannose-1-phosphate guanylyltransferase